MKSFCAYLVLSLLTIVLYTLFVSQAHGWNLLYPFFNAIGSVTWQGQFNLDFLSFLSLSAVWVSWRHHFTPLGLILGILAFFGGMLFLASYLLWACMESNGRSDVMLLGKTRTIS